MGLKMRLARVGGKKNPFYHVVIADSRAPRNGRFIERIGLYGPLLAADHADRVKFVSERVTYWLGKGALPSERVARLLGHAGLRPMPAIRQQPKQSAPRKKAKAA